MNSEINFYRFVGSILSEALLGEEDKAAELHQRRMRDREVINKMSDASDKADFMDIKTGSTPRGSEARKGAARYLKGVLAARRARREAQNPTP